MSEQRTTPDYVGSDHSASITPQYAKADDLGDLAGLVQRWTTLLVAEDTRLDRRIDWAQRRIALLQWCVTVLALTCCVLAVAIVAQGVR